MKNVKKETFPRRFAGNVDNLGSQDELPTNDFGVFVPWIRMLAPLRTLLFLTTLQFNMGPWPFYAQLGEAETQSRAQYYTSFAVLALSLVMLCVHLPVIWRYLARNLDIVTFMAFAVIREAFTGDVSAVIVSLAYVQVFSAVALIVLIDGVERTLTISFYFSAYVLLANLVGFAFPSITFMRGGTLHGVYRGFTSQRNELGMAVNFAFLAILSRPRWGGGLGSAMMGACFILLVACGSVQAMVTALASWGIFMLYRMDQINYGTKFFLLMGILVVGSITVIFLPDTTVDTLFGIVGRDTSFSGRDNIWALAIYYIDRVPFWGYGMGQFTSETIPPDILLAYKLGTKFGSAHSSYLEAIIDFGWIGAAVFFLVIGRHTLRILFDLFRPRSQASGLPVILTFMCVIGGLIEAARLLAPNGGWIVFVMAKLLFDEGRQQVTQRRLATNGLAPLVSYDRTRM